LLQYHQLADWRKLSILNEEEEDWMTCPSTSSSLSYIPHSCQEPHLIKQSDINHVIWDPNLSRQETKLWDQGCINGIASWGTRLSIFKKINHKLLMIYGMKDILFAPRHGWTGRRIGIWTQIWRMVAIYWFI
jgi:hypothetical protein